MSPKISNLFKKHDKNNENESALDPATWEMLQQGLSERMPWTAPYLTEGALSTPAEPASPEGSSWSIATLEGIPGGLPFVNGRQYLHFHREGYGYGGDPDLFYADAAARNEVCRIVADAERKQALVAQECDLPRLSSSLDLFEGLEPFDAYRGDRTFVDNDRAGWLVCKGLTPTGRVRKYPYEVTYSARDLDSPASSHGTILYGADGAIGKIKPTYWRESCMYDVQFVANGNYGAELSRIDLKDLNNGNAKTTIWQRQI